MKRSMRVLGVAAGMLAQGAWTAPAPKPAGPAAPVWTMEGYSTFAEGTWATYECAGGGTNGPFRMTVASLERARKGRTPLMTMEIVVEMTNQPAVVTRMVAEDTPAGPGKPKEAVVQIAGYSPLQVPRRDLERGGAQGQPSIRRLGQPGAAAPVATPVRVDFKGAAVNAVRVNATDEKGRAVEAVVATNFPPLGLYSVKTPDATMRLLDCGGGATSRIAGRARGMFGWLFEVIGKAASGQGPEPAPAPAP